MRHSTLLALTTLAFAALTGAAHAQPIQTAVDATFAPHAMPKLGGGIEGFNVDMANEIGKRLNRPIMPAAAISRIIQSCRARSSVSV